LFHTLGTAFRNTELNMNDGKPDTDDLETSKQHMPGAVRSVERAIDILRILSFSSASHGMRFQDLQTQTNLPKATLHRLIATLIMQGMVERVTDSNLYYLGLEFLGFGERSSNRLDLRTIVRPHLVGIAKITGDTAHLVIRSGIDAVYIDREEGNFPVRALTASIGTRRPLGIGSASLALLAALPDSEIKEIFRRNRTRLSAYPNFDVTALRKMIQHTRMRGSAINEGRILKGMYGIGMPIMMAGKPIAAISVSANAKRMAIERQLQIVSVLRTAARQIASDLGDTDEPSSIQ